MIDLDRYVRVYVCPWCGGSETFKSHSIRKKCIHCGTWKTGRGSFISYVPKKSMELKNKNLDRLITLKNDDARNLYKHFAGFTFIEKSEIVTRCCWCGCSVMNPRTTGIIFHECVECKTLNYLYNMIMIPERSIESVDINIGKEAVNPPETISLGILENYINWVVCPWCRNPSHYPLSRMTVCKDCGSIYDIFRTSVSVPVDALRMKCNNFDKHLGFEEAEKNSIRNRRSNAWNPSKMR